MIAVFGQTLATNEAEFRRVARNSTEGFCYRSAQRRPGGLGLATWNDVLRFEQTERVQSETASCIIRARRRPTLSILTANAPRYD